MDPVGREAELAYYAVAGAVLGDLIWMAAERGISIIELVISISLMISAVSSAYHDLEDSIPLLFSFLIPFLAVQVLLSFWYLSSIASLTEFNYLSGYLLTTSMVSSVIFAASFLMFSFAFRFVIEMMS
ncbi:hypothetical protein KEJ49_07635 [Candidatus Bathyarchaeota archaeon]|nr:hypothetical protein [Candidatus Bathyarchaeota archaeon]